MYPYAPYRPEKAFTYPKFAFCLCSITHNCAADATKYFLF